MASPCARLLLLAFLGPRQHAEAGARVWPRTLKAQGAPEKTPVHLVGVQPYSGGAGTLGYKVEPMIRLALEHIQAHPTLLPNHKLVMHFVDSGCSNRQATDAIFEQHVVGPKKFGVFGAACTGACMAASDVSRNFKTVNLAQLCTGTAMSDASVYPEFARFSPDLDKNSKAAVDLTSLFGWSHLAVVMENQGLFTDMGERLAKRIRDDPSKTIIAFEKVFPMPTDLESNLDIAGVIDRLIEAEARIMLVVGYELTIARIFCEASRRGFVGKKVVFVYATFWINRDWYQEFAPRTRCSPAEILAAGQGLLGIDRLRLAPDSAGPHSGSGLLPSELMAEYHGSCDPALNASDPGRYGCADMHSAYSYDATWGWAFTLDRWLRAGHNVSEVDYVSGDARRSFFQTEVAEQDFRGLTGRVRHYPGGDRDGELQIFQFRGTSIETLGSVVDQGLTFAWSGLPIWWGGLQDSSFDPVALASAGAGGRGVLWPSDRPRVCAAPLHLAFDPEDVLGTESCRPCPGGHRFLLDGALGRCLPCDSGTVRAEGAASPLCSTCEVGTFANETGQTLCQPCPEGHVCRAGAIQPQECALGSFAPHGFEEAECLQCSPGTYANETAMARCRSCEELIPGSTTATAARSAADCRCGAGYLLLHGGRCEACDGTSMDCPGGKSQHVVAAREGFFLGGVGIERAGSVQLYVDMPVPFRCSTSDDCPGGLGPGQCPAGHGGLVCAKCAEGYTRWSGRCVPCGGSARWTVLIVPGCMLASLLAAVALLRGSTEPYMLRVTRSNALATTSGLIVVFVQLHQVLDDISISWPQAFRDSVLFCANVLNVEVNAAGLECSGSTGALSAFIPKLLLYPLVLLQLLLLWVVGRALWPSGCVLLTTPGNRLTKDSLLNAMGQVTNLAFVPLAVHATGVFNCYGHPQGQSSMRMIPFVLCFERDWARTMLPLGVASLLLFVLAPLAVMMQQLRAAPAMQNAKRRLPFLVGRFRPEMYWWGLVTLVRNLLLALAVVAAPQQPFVAAWLLVSITQVYLFATLRHSPWKFRTHNFMDGLASASFALVLFVGTAFAETATYPNVDERQREDPSWTLLAVVGAAPFFASLGAMLLCACLAARQSSGAHQQRAEELLGIVERSVRAAGPVFWDMQGRAGAARRITSISFHEADCVRTACKILDSMASGRALHGKLTRLSTRADLEKQAPAAALEAPPAALEADCARSARPGTCRVIDTSGISTVVC